MLEHTPRLALVALLASAACHTYAPRSGPVDPAVAPARPASAGEDRVAPFCERFAAQVLAVRPQPGSAGVLPLVSRDLARAEPFVAELGVEIVDDIALRLAQGGLGARVLSSTDMQLRVAQANLSKASFPTLASAAAGAERLGVDLVVSGSILRRDRQGSKSRDVLAIEVWAWDAASGRVVAREKLEVPSDEPGARRAWDLAQSESTWSPDGLWRVPEAAPTLQRELEIVCGVLAGRLVRTLDLERVQGSLYVAPLDTARFVRASATLRAAQAAWAAETGRRQTSGAGAGADAGRITLAGIEFASLQQAEGWLAQLTAGLSASEAARFSQGVSAQLAQELGTRCAPHKVRLQDAGFVAAHEQLMIAGELAQGGLARNADARAALAAQGVGLVVAPRLERVGDSLVLRVEAYDLAAGALLGSAHALISPAFERELGAALGSESESQDGLLAGVGDPQREARESWEALFPRVRSGVVQVSTDDGRGSGFLARRDGLLMTNAHVVGARQAVRVRFDDGSECAASVVARDEFWDLAVLRAERTPSSAHVFELRDEVAVGMEVAVLGHPRGTQGWVLTPGYISSLSELGPTASPGGQRPSVMYTCPTRQGASGSPVLALDGRVAAVHSASFLGLSADTAETRTELTGFALGAPVREARRLLDSVGAP